MDSRIRGNDGLDVQSRDAMKLPSIIAHRGCHETAPENSLAAIGAALAAGVDVEIDVHATHDGIVVVHHDHFVHAGFVANQPSQTTISEVRYRQLLQLPLADGSAIPTLEEVLSLTNGRAHVYVEIKARGIEKRVLELLASSGVDASVHSFDHRIVKRCGEIDPDVRRGILMVSYLVDTVRVMLDADASDVWQNYEFVDADLVGEVHTAGGRVIAWTVNSPVDAVLMAQSGADAICTDSVHEMRTAMQT